MTDCAIKVAAFMLVLPFLAVIVAVGAVACVIYDVLRGLWVTWCWLKEVGR